jgi:hypothetical protein
VHICHESLSGAARAMAVASGMEHYEWLTVPYPHTLDGEWDAAETEQIAKEIAPQVLARLTVRPQRST